jgi:5-(carboxyamino)imidazole ribonucleotide mutase
VASVEHKPGTKSGPTGRTKGKAGLGVAVRVARASRTASESSASRVAILMGSKNDLEVMRHAAETLSKLGVPNEVRVISAHRTPERLHEFVRGAEARGFDVIIAGAGGAAHLAGVTASLTLLPVLGVPIDSSALRGMDALLATVQMPGGIPVGTLAIGKAGAINAALLAVAFLARTDPVLRERLAEFRREQAAAIPDGPL